MARIDTGLNSYVALSHSPRLLAWLHACFGIGAASGPIIMTAVLAAGQPWRLGYAIVGVAQLGLAACFLVTRKQWTMTTPERAAPSPPPPPPCAGEGESDPTCLPSPAHGGGGSP